MRDNSGTIVASPSMVPARHIDLGKLRLTRGVNIENAKQRMCATEAIAYLAGEPWSCNPACVCPALVAFINTWNALLDDSELQILKSVIPAVIGTNDWRSGHRWWMAADWLTRECAASLLALVPELVPHASELFRLPELRDNKSLAAAGPVIMAAMEAAFEIGEKTSNDDRKRALLVARKIGIRAALSAVQQSPLDHPLRPLMEAVHFAAWNAILAAPRQDLFPVAHDLQLSALDLIHRMALLSRDGVHPYG